MSVPRCTVSKGEAIRMEQDILDGFASMRAATLETASALQEFRKCRAYLVLGFNTFNEWLASHRGISRVHAWRLMKWLNVIHETRDLLPKGWVPCENAVKPITKLKTPQARRDAMQKAIALAKDTGHGLTESLVRAAMQKRGQKPCDDTARCPLCGARRRGKIDSWNRLQRATA